MSECPPFLRLNIPDNLFRCQASPNNPPSCPILASSTTTALPPVRECLGGSGTPTLPKGDQAWKKLHAAKQVPVLVREKTQANRTISAQRMCTGGGEESEEMILTQKFTVYKSTCTHIT